MPWRPYLLLFLLVASVIVGTAWVKIPSVRDGMTLLGRDAIAAVKARM